MTEYDPTDHHVHTVPVWLVSFDDKFGMKLPIRGEASNSQLVDLVHKAASDYGIQWTYAIANHTDGRVVRIRPRQPRDWEAGWPVYDR